MQVDIRERMSTIMAPSKFRLGALSYIKNTTIQTARYGHDKCDVCNNYAMIYTGRSNFCQNCRRLLNTVSATDEQIRPDTDTHADLVTAARMELAKLRADDMCFINIDVPTKPCQICNASSDNLVGIRGGNSPAFNVCLPCVNTKLTDI